MTTARRSFLKTASCAPLAWMAGCRSDESSLVKELRITHLGVCAHLEDHALFSKLGYDYLEGAVGRVLMPQVSDAEFAVKKAEIQATGVNFRGAHSFIPAHIKTTGPKQNVDRALQHTQVTLERAAQLGLKYIVFGSGDSRRYPESFSQERAETQFVALLKQMALIAEKTGVDLYIEPLRSEETNLVNTLLDGARVSAAVNHPSIGIVADLWHMAQNGESAKNILSAAQHIKHLHIAENEGRRPPGTTTGYTFEAELSALKSIGYEGALSVECKWGDKNQPAEAAKALSFLRQSLAKLT